MSKIVLILKPTIGADGGLINVGDAIIATTASDAHMVFGTYLGYTEVRAAKSWSKVNERIDTKIYYQPAVKGRRRHINECEWVAVNAVTPPPHTYRMIRR